MKLSGQVAIVTGGGSGQGGIAAGQMGHMR